MKYVMILLVLLCAGCSPAYDYVKGDCVYIEVLFTGSTDTFKAEYWKYDNRSHWYRVDGKVGGVPSSSSTITGCDDES